MASLLFNNQCVVNLLVSNFVLRGIASRIKSDTNLR